MTLALRFGTEAGYGFPCRMYSNLAGVEHLQAKNIEVFRRACPNNFRETADPDSHQLAALSFLRLFLSQFGVTDFLHGLAQSAFVVTAVVLPAQDRLVRKSVGSDEILQPEIRRIHFQVVRHDVDHAFNRMRRFRHTK